jgi:hypothetical protein
LLKGSPASSAMATLSNMRATPVAPARTAHPATPAFRNDRRLIGPSVLRELSSMSLPDTHRYPSFAIFHILFSIFECFGIGVDS